MVSFLRHLSTRMFPVHRRRLWNASSFLCAEVVLVHASGLAPRGRLEAPFSLARTRRDAPCQFRVGVVVRVWLMVGPSMTWRERTPTNYDSVGRTDPAMCLAALIKNYVDSTGDNCCSKRVRWRAAGGFRFGISEGACRVADAEVTTMLTISKRTSSLRMGPGFRSMLVLFAERLAKLFGRYRVR